MRHTCGLGSAQARGQPGRQGGQRAERQRPVLADDLGQRWAGHVGQGQPRLGADRVRGDHLSRERAAHLLSRGDLTQEPGPEFAVGGQVGTDDLHGHGPAVRRLAQEYQPYTALSQPSEQQVRPDPFRIPGLQS